MSSRTCTECGESIPANRLAAVPGATQCVPCLQAAGDVPRIKRFDETTKDDLVVETYYVRNPYIELQQAKQRIAVLDQANFNTNDDARLNEEPNHTLLVDPYTATDEKIDRERRHKEKAKARKTEQTLVADSHFAATQLNLAGTASVYFN